MITLKDEAVHKGHYKIKWDTKNMEGKETASGVYMCALYLDNQLQDVKKLILIR